MFQHDATKIRACKRFRKGTCTDAHCPFPHIKKEPKDCKFFIAGKCTVQNCKFKHPKIEINHKKIYPKIDVEKIQSQNKEH